VTSPAYPKRAKTLKVTANLPAYSVAIEPPGISSAVHLE
jgi:hypothetical protein